MSEGVGSGELHGHLWERLSREESGPGGWDSLKRRVLVSVAGEGERVLPSRAREGWGVQGCLCPATGLVSDVG